MKRGMILRVVGKQRMKLVDQHKIQKPVLSAQITLYGGLFLRNIGVLRGHGTRKRRGVKGHKICVKLVAFSRAILSEPVVVDGMNDMFTDLGIVASKGTSAIVRIGGRNIQCRRRITARADPQHTG